MSFYKGTSIEQDARFRNKEKSIIENTKYPKEFEIKIDTDKVILNTKLYKIELKVIKSWIEKRLLELLGFDDEFLTNYIITLLEAKSDELDPKKIQLLLTGFLNQDTPNFMLELWKLLISAQNSPNGIPEELIKEKEEELKKQSEHKTEKIKFLEKILGDKLPEDKKVVVKEEKGEHNKERKEVDTKKTNKEKEKEKDKEKDKKYHSHKSDKDKKKRESKHHKERKSRDHKKKRRRRSSSSSSESSSRSKSYSSGSRSRSRDRDRDRTSKRR